jgi:alkanesulfonate monooxygenase SsuD/methylene tetrahydromethanopterin reductase-like flavin-dependent oxidoreductase (luciferase family)
MRFGVFYEHQLPRPWELDAEHRLFKDALEQIELADRIGIDYLWEVEHHFLEEYSHSSAPEVFLAAASQRTSRIRIGHGIVQLPFGFNHPARVAERIATLDLISDGRVEFGTGEASSEMELGGFGVERARKRAEWTEALDVVTRLMVESPFAGHEGPGLTVPPRNLVPKPLQKPHPPLWVACSRRDTIHLAATKGIGALSFSFIEADEARHWVNDYYDTIASEDCVPGGFSVNANLACVLPFMCHPDESTAIERGLDGGHFFGYSLAHYYAFGVHRLGEAGANTDVWEEFQRNRSAFGFDRRVAAREGQVLGAKLLEQGLGSLRGAIGTPDQIRDLVRHYEEVGVDQLIFVSQAGRNRHEHICESLELFGQEVLPEFAERADAADAAKAERLEQAVAAARARRPPPRTLPEPFEVPALPAP